jgi:hypothetical protein
MGKRGAQQDLFGVSPQLPEGCIYTPGLGALGWGWVTNA